MPGEQNYLSQMYFKINGAYPPDALKNLVREISVDSSLSLPDMFTISFDDPSMKCIDSHELDIGKTIEISGKPSGEKAAALLLQGEIVAVEPELTQAAGMTVIIRGYDKSHRLHRGKKSRSFIKMTDSDIVKEIARSCGLAVKADSTPVVYEHVIQDNRTDMEFIHERAQRAGFISWVENGTIHFLKSSSSAAPVVLEWGKNLTDFQARLSSAGQVNNSEVHGWDVKQKQPITGNRTSPTDTPRVDGQNHGGQLASQGLGVKDIKEVINSQPVETQSEAEMLAQSRLNEVSQSFFQAEGKCWGNTAIRAGKKVEIKGIGHRFSGQYLVTRAVHRYDISGYATSFEISGYHPNTLREILQPADQPNVYGVVVALVTDVKDPDGMARVKVKYPTISDKMDSHWARLASPMAGPQRGFQFIPELNDEVLIAFEYNDINKPYVIGALWNGKDAPPEKGGSLIGDKGQVQKRVIKTRSGHTITFDDTERSEKISIVDKSGQKIILDSTPNSEKIEINDKSGQKVILDSSAGQEKVEVIDKTGKSRVLLDAVKQSVMIESAMDLTIKATGKIQMDGQMGVSINTTAGNLELKSNAQTTINGTQTSIQGTAMAEMKSGAGGKVVVTGPMVMLN
jgi:phage protein D